MGIDYSEMNNWQISYIVSAGLYVAGYEEPSAERVTNWAVDLCPIAASISSRAVE